MEGLRIRSEVKRIRYEIADRNLDPISQKKIIIFKGTGEVIFRIFYTTDITTRTYNMIRQVFSFLNASPKSPEIVKTGHRRPPKMGTLFLEWNTRFPEWIARFPERGATFFSCEIEIE